MSASSAVASGAGSGKVDMNLYSRQLGVYGMETMGKLITMKVLIVGMTGTGIEIAKNVILAGPQTVTIHDPALITITDVGQNYFCREADIGKRRDEVCVPRLKELNPYVLTSVLGGDLNEKAMSEFTLVVMCNAGMSEIIKFDNFCRVQTPAIGFISVNQYGIAGRVFVDFGSAFTIFDTNGESNRSAVVIDVCKSEKNVLVTCHDNKRHGFHDGDHVSFREVEGMTQLNTMGPIEIAKCTAYSFELKVDPTSLSDYTGGGVVEQVKVPTKISFQSFEESLLKPAKEGEMMIMSDLARFGEAELLHPAFYAIDTFRERNGRFPRVRNEEDIAAMLTIAKDFVEANKDKPEFQPKEYDADKIRRTVKVAALQFQPLSAFFGGIVAQEVVKFTGKFTPIGPFFYFDSPEVLPADDGDDFKPIGSRYDSLIELLGKGTVDRIRHLKVFLVGSGALGCEFLKNFAMLGVASADSGKITVTDMDNIEVSNLNRQFLFRPDNVGSFKSTTAAAAVRVMNPDIHVDSRQTPVGHDSEHIFSDAFWEPLDIIVNALDNVKARKYMDDRCVFFCKPLLESGTLGTKTNVQVIMPRLTESYTDSEDPAEDSIPMCTLKNFPFLLEHCIEWSRDMFQGCFTQSVQEAVSFIADPTGWIRKTAAEVNPTIIRINCDKVLGALRLATGCTYASCVAEARKLLNSKFFLDLSQLLHNFPADAITKDGSKFWSGPKRQPTPTMFDITNEMHRSFIVHAACLFATNHGVELPEHYDSIEVLASILAKVPVEGFAAKKVSIKSGDDDKTTEGGADDGDVAKKMIKHLEEYAKDIAALRELKLIPAEFEKDDDSNHHIDFITGASNLRAANYRIPEGTRHQVKMIAGRIIPAIATTTCSVTGLVSIEFIKLAMKKPFESFRNTFANLAVNIYQMTEPAPSKKKRTVKLDPILMGPVRAHPEGFTKWDMIHLSVGDLTFEGLIKWIKETQKLDCSIVVSGAINLYNPIVSRAHRETRSSRKIQDVFVEDPKAILPAGQRYIVLDAAVEDEGGDVIIPHIVYHF